jgi:hypothetical protein
MVAKRAQIALGAAGMVSFNAILAKDEYHEGKKESNGPYAITSRTMFP